MTPLPIPAVLYVAWTSALVLRRPLLGYLVHIGWTRKNYQGNPIPRGSGLVVLAAAGVWMVYLAVLSWPGRGEAGVLAAALLFGLLGLLDDWKGDRGTGGLRGHFRLLLRERKLTTGVVKAVVGALGALAVAWWLSPSVRPGLAAAQKALWVLAAGGTLALCANAVNLLDTRPCRSLAAFAALEALLYAVQGMARPQWGPLVVIAAAAPVALPERRRQAMLGDTGANLLGGVAGAHAVLVLPDVWLAGLLLLLLWLHLFTERRSLNAAIGANPLLSRLDRWVQG